MILVHDLLPPRQERSARTLAAVLEAAEALLAERPPAEVSIAEICRRAGVTTGAFYARFRDREALFRVLENRVYGAFEAELSRILAPDAGPGRLEGTLERIIRATARLYRDHRGTLRALSVLAVSDAGLATRAAAFNRELLHRVVAHTAAHRDQIPHDDPEASVREAVVWVVTILRQQILFEELALQGLPAPEEGLVRLAYIYLTSPRSLRDEE